MSENWGATAEYLARSGYYTAADVAYRKAQPEPENLLNHANVLRRLMRYAESEQFARRALELHPDHFGRWQVEALLGCLALDNNDAETAVRILDQHKHRDGFQMFCYALACLHAGRYAEGFAAYDGRLEKHTQPLPLWNGDTMGEHETVAITCEQGYGDTIMFYRFLEGLPFKHFLLAPNALHRLLPNAQSGNISFSATHMLPLMSLPRRLGATAIPPWKPYICPPMRFSLPRAPDTKLNVGLVWRSKSGATQRKYDEVRHGEQKTVPLDLLLPLAQIPNVKLYSLQHEGVDDIGKLGAGYLLDNLDNRIMDFADLAGFMHEMDVIVSCDSGPAHLAGAMGKKTLVLLNYAGTWQYQSGTRTPWYPNHEIFRQKTPGDWRLPITEAYQRIAEMAAFPTGRAAEGLT